MRNVLHSTNIVASLIVTLCATSAGAEPMSASDFERYTNGKTLFFSRGGAAYGAERYLENRRVQWSFLDGVCQDGQWYPQGDQICFVYEANPTPQCWRFYETTDGLAAEFVDDSAADPSPRERLYEAQDATAEMVCLGPKVGV